MAIAAILWSSSNCRADSLLSSVAWDNAVATDGGIVSYLTGNSFPVNETRTASFTNSSYDVSAIANYNYTDDGTMVKFRIDTTFSLRTQGDVEEANGLDGPVQLNFTISQPMLYTNTLGISMTGTGGAVSTDILDSNPGPFQVNVFKNIFSQRGTNLDHTFSLTSGILLPGTYTLGESSQIHTGQNPGDSLVANGTSFLEFTLQPVVAVPLPSAAWMGLAVMGGICVWQAYRKANAAT